MNLRHKVVCLSLVLSFFGAGPVWGALGDPLWEQTFNYLPNYDNTQPHSCAASSGILIVCGSASKQTSTSLNSLGFIRAYDAATGALKWQGVPLTLASTPDAYNSNALDGIIISGNIAMVQGSAYSLNVNTYPPTTTFNKSILRAYNIDNGTLLWENIKDGNTLTSSNSFATTISRVFIVGGDTPPISTITPSGGWVRAYQIPGNALPLSLLLDEQK